MHRCESNSRPPWLRRPPGRRQPLRRQLEWRPSTASGCLNLRSRGKTRILHPKFAASIGPLTLRPTPRNESVAGPIRGVAPSIRTQWRQQSASGEFRLQSEFPLHRGAHAAVRGRRTACFGSGVSGLPQGSTDAAPRHRRVALSSVRGVSLRVERVRAPETQQDPLGSERFRRPPIALVTRVTSGPGGPHKGLARARAHQYTDRPHDHGQDPTAARRCGRTPADQGHGLSELQIESGASGGRDRLLPVSPVRALLGGVVSARATGSETLSSRDRTLVAHSAGTSGSEESDGRVDLPPPAFPNTATFFTVPFPRYRSHAQCGGL
jgi:hypothetical protein